MTDGGVLQILRAPRARRAAVLLGAAALVLAACGTSGGGDSQGASPDDAVTSTTAAAEPAGSQMVRCEDLDPLAWTASPTDADLPFQIGAGEAPGLGGSTSGPPDSAAVYKTADEFLAQSNVPDPAARKQVMDAAGYAGGIEADWTQDPSYKVQSLTFADPAGAAAYVEARLPSMCGQGGTQGGVTILDDGDGITWTDPLGATHGEFIFGGSQVSLTSCGGCDPVSLDQMQAWHDAFVEAYATGPAAPIS
ncbi:MAG: hypothetical protein ACTHN0_06490 [Aquihabitans sp.]